MRKIKIILLLSLAFYGCSDLDEDLCNETCADVMSVVPKTRTLKGGVWFTTYFLTLKKQCNGSIFNYVIETRNSKDVYVEQICNNDFKNR